LKDDLDLETPKSLNKQDENSIDEGSKVRAHTIEYGEKKRELNIPRNDLSQQSRTQKKRSNDTSFDLKIEKTITDKTKHQDNLTLPIFDIPKSQVAIRSSISKSTETVSVPTRSIRLDSSDLDFEFKTNQSSSSSNINSEEKQKKEIGSFLNSEGNFQIPKFDNLEIECESIIPVSDLPRSDVEIRRLIPKSKVDYKGKISITKFTIPSESANIEL
jgi:hypothetical protein